MSFAHIDLPVVVDVVNERGAATQRRNPSPDYVANEVARGVRGFDLPKSSDRL